MENETGKPEQELGTGNTAEVATQEGPGRKKKVSKKKASKKKASKKKASKKKASKKKASKKKASKKKASKKKASKKKASKKKASKKKASKKKASKKKASKKRGVRVVGADENPYDKVLAIVESLKQAVHELAADAATRRSFIRQAREENSRRLRAIEDASISDLNSL